MEVNRLLSDELTYELLIRGMSRGKTVAEKRTLLREVLRNEEHGMLMPSRVHLDPLQEVNICRQKLEDLEEDIRNFNPQNRQNEFKRIYSRLIHISERLRRIAGSDVSQEIDRLSLVNKITQLMENLNAAYEDIEVTQPEIAKYAMDNENRESGHSILDEDNPSIHQNILNPTVSFDLVRLDGPTYSNRSRERDEVPFSSHNSRVSPESPDNLPESRLACSGRSNPTHNEFGTNLRIPREPIGAVEVLQRQFTNLATVESHTIPVNNLYPTTTEHGQTISASVKHTIGSRSDSRVQFRPVEISSPAGDNWSRLGEPPTPVGSYRNPSQERPSRSSNYHPYLPVSQLGEVTLPATDGTVNSESKFVDVTRWNVRFNGRGSVNEFLERIEELRISRGVSKTQLLRSAPELFAQEALWWYRTQSFSSWDELTTKLKLDYLPYDYEYTLWDEIRHRTQGTHEKIRTFVISIENMFRKLSQYPSEETRVNLIRRNLLPSIQKQLALQEISSVSDLIRLARSVEETEERTQRFLPPPTSHRGLLEPELAYRKPIAGHQAVAVVNTGEEPIRTRPTEKLPETSNASSVTCWNCNSTSHKFRACPEPRKKFCFRCGRPNVVADTCPKCRKNLKMGPQ